MKTGLNTVFILTDIIIIIRPIIYLFFKKEPACSGC